MHSTNDGRINRLWFPRCGFCLKKTFLWQELQEELREEKSSKPQVWQPGCCTWLLELVGKLMEITRVEHSTFPVPDPRYY